VGAFLRGLLGSAERKDGWQVAEVAGEVAPDGMQRVLYQALRWAEATAGTSALWGEKPRTRVGLWRRGRLCSRLARPKSVRVRARRS
jgi:hypothetical protein